MRVFFAGDSSICRKIEPYFTTCYSYHYTPTRQLPWNCLIEELIDDLRNATFRQLLQIFKPVLPNNINLAFFLVPFVMEANYADNTTLDDTRFLESVGNDPIILIGAERKWQDIEYDRGTKNFIEHVLKIARRVNEHMSQTPKIMDPSQDRSMDNISINDCNVLFVVSHGIDALNSVITRLETIKLRQIQNGSSETLLVEIGKIRIIRECLYQISDAIQDRTVVNLALYCEDYTRALVALEHAILDDCCDRGKQFDYRNPELSESDSHLLSYLYRKLGDSENFYAALKTSSRKSKKIKILEAEVYEDWESVISECETRFFEIRHRESYRKCNKNVSF